MEIVSVDPRDQSWEIDKPRYRVYFWDAAATSYEYEVSQADDVAEVMAWAEAERGTRTFTLYACVQHDGLGLVRLAGLIQPGRLRGDSGALSAANQCAGELDVEAESGRAFDSVREGSA